MEPIVRRNKRRRKTLLRVAVYGTVLTTLLLAGINLYLVLHPEQIHLRIERLLAEHLAVPFDIGRVEYDFSGRITLHDVYVESPYGARLPHVLELDTVAIRLNPLGILTGGNPFTRIKIENPRVFLEMDDQGALTLARALRETSRERPDLRDRLPRVHVNNLWVEVDAQSVAPVEPLHFPYVSVELPSDATGDFEVRASLRHRDVSGIALRGRGNTRLGRFDGRVDVSRLRIDRHLRDILPAENLEYWDQFDPQGVANLTIECAFAEHAAPTWRTQLTILEGSLDLKSPPVTIEALSGSVEVSNERIAILEPLKGMIWRSDATLSDGRLEFATGQLDFTLEVEQVPLEAESRKLLEHEALAELRKLWDDLSPRGSVGVKLNARGNAYQIDDFDLELALRHMSIAYREFPYEMSGLNGSIKVKDGHLTAGLAGGGTEMQLEIRCETEVRPGGPFDLSVKCRGLPLDQRLVQAGPPQLGEFFRSYRPEGVIDTDLHVRRLPETGALVSSLTIEAADCAITYHRFPYRIEGIHGTTHLEFAPKSAGLRRIEFGQIEGHHGDDAIRLDGGEIVFRQGSPPHVDMTIQCPVFALEGSLYDAMSPETQAVVRSFGLDGEVAASLSITNQFQAGGAEGPIEVVFEGTVLADSPLRVSYAPLPLPLTFRSGMVRLDLTRDLYHIIDFVSDENLGPGVRVAGVLENDPDDIARKHFVLNLEIGAGKRGDVEIPGLELSDEKLVQSLPADLRNFVEQLRLGGFLQGKLVLDYSFRPQVGGGSKEERVNYTASVSAYACKVNVGAQFTDIVARLELDGRFEPDHPHSFQCTAEVKECRLSRFKPQNLTLVASYGEPNDAVLLAQSGKFRSANPIPSESQDTVELFTLGEPFTSRLVPGNLDNVLQIYIKRGDLYGGAIEGFAFADLGWRKDYHVHIQASGVDLGNGAQDLFPGALETKGLGKGFIKFGGDLAVPQSLNGGGHVVIRDGRLKDIGLAVVILRPLQILSDESRYITSLDCRFQILHDRFLVTEFFDEDGEPNFVLKTPADLRLLGRGYLDFAQWIRMNIRYQVFETGIGWFDDVLRTITPFDSLTLEGPVDNPKIQLNALN